MRPFKDLKEFKEKTGLGLGYIVSVRVKQDIFPPECYLHDGMITGFNYGDKTVCIGGRTYSLETLSKFEYLEAEKWLPFGVVVPEETENKKNAKFKVGHMYKDADKDGVFMVTAKYTNPLDNKTYLIVQRLSLHLTGQGLYLIRKDENEDEFIKRCTVDYRLVDCSAKDEVEKIEKEIPLY